MEKTVEIEYKTFVSGEAASTLLAQGVFKNGQLQTNFYYDTRDRAFTAKLGVLRIREKNDNFRFTAKIKRETHIDEFECELIDKNIYSEEILKFVALYTDVIEFDYLGKTTTYRYTYDDDFGVWCLDFNVFKFTSDIELEFELHEGILDAYEHYLKQLTLWGIVHHPSASKFQRLLKEKDIL